MTRETVSSPSVVIRRAFEPDEGVCAEAIAALLKKNAAGEITRLAPHPREQIGSPVTDPSERGVKGETQDKERSAYAESIP